MSYSTLAGFAPTKEEIATVATLLGREPQIPFRVAARGGVNGRIWVIENLPVDCNGNPNPNWFWLVDPLLKKSIDQVESRGGVKRAEALFDPQLLGRVHRLYASGRNALAQELGAHAPAGGVGGARAGVKCLHAHVAYYLAGGYSPVGLWALQKGVEGRRPYV